MGGVTRCYVVGGEIVDTGDPVYPISAMVWPIYATCAGVFAGCLARLKLSNPIRTVAAMLLGYVVLYGPPMGLSRLYGNQGIWGLLGYPGDAHEWSILKIACLASPIALAVATVAVCASGSASKQPLDAAQRSV